MWLPSAPMGAEGRFHHSFCPPIYFQCKITMQNVHMTADEVVLIEKIMEGLPPLQAQILRMKEIDGYDKEEIMKITGCTAESLRQNLSRARRRIREEFLRITTYNRMRHD